jgi:hypothetical protein
MTTDEPDLTVATGVNRNRIDGVNWYLTGVTDGIY